MQTDKKWFYIMVTVVMVSLIWGMVASENNELETKKDLKYLNCVESMQKAIPDPNDDGRMSFLQDCYEK